MKQEIIEELSAISGMAPEELADRPMAELKRLLAEYRSAPSADSRFPVPARDPIYVDPIPEYSALLDKRSRKDGKPRNIAIHGPAGAGKTSYGIQFAARFRRPLYVLNVGSLAEPSEVLGHWEAKEGTTVWVHSDLWHAIQVPYCVVVLDELNRGFSLKTLNALLPMLDDRRNLDGAAVAEGVVFFATLNEGLEYVGTDELDAAIDDRFSEGVRLTYPSNEVALLVEQGIDPAMANNLYRLVSNLRGSHPISLRAMRSWADMVLNGASPWYALLFTIGRRVNIRELLSACHLAWPDLKIHPVQGVYDG